MKNQKKEPWRIVVGILAIIYIVYMWVEKDVLAIYASMPKEEALPLIVTTIVVSLVKVAIIVIGILFIKWIIGRINKNN